MSVQCEDPLVLTREQFPLSVAGGVVNLCDEHPSQKDRPFILRFAALPREVFDVEEHRYDPVRQVNLRPDGTPLCMEPGVQVGITSVPSRTPTTCRVHTGTRTSNDMGPDSRTDYDPDPSPRR